MRSQQAACHRAFACIADMNTHAGMIIFLRWLNCNTTGMLVTQEQLGCAYCTALEDTLKVVRHSSMCSRHTSADKLRQRKALWIPAKAAGGRTCLLRLSKSDPELLSWLHLQRIAHRRQHPGIHYCQQACLALSPGLVHLLCACCL